MIGSEIGEVESFLVIEGGRLPGGRERSFAAPQKENQKRADNENYDSSRPQEPSAFAAISSDDHTARRQKQNGEDKRSQLGSAT